jgi:alkylation response protein AidB-like acyl-CoA dehydrogenase
MPESSSNRAAEYIDRVRQLAPVVRQHASESDLNAQISPAVIEAFHDAGLFRILLPSSMAGGDLTIPDALRVFEEVARVDGSAGWNMSICAGGPLFGHFVGREAFSEIYSDPSAVTAGSLNATTSVAVPVQGGWRLTGKATNASGSAHASYLMAAGVVLRDGKPELIDNIPAMRAALFAIKNCKILDTWSVSGMRGTGSNDCVFENVFVPEEFTFEWPNPSANWKTGAFGTIPLSVQLGGGFAAVALGIARHAIEAFVELASAKVPIGGRSTLRERPLAQIQLAQAEAFVQAGRAYFVQCYDDIWRKGERGESFDDRVRADARLASVSAAKFAAQAVDLIYDAAGLSAIQTSCAIERCWRDVHAVTQHILMSTGRYEIVGRVLFGLPPGFPII